MALPMNTGAEAVETAVKAARRWGYESKGIEADKAEIIVCSGNFHWAHHNHYFLLGGNGVSKELRSADAGIPNRGIRRRRCARSSHYTQHRRVSRGTHTEERAASSFRRAGYLRRCHEICRNNNVLLIADEIQTGLGRTGRLLACDHEDVKPDGLILGKALGGGILPVSMFLGRQDVMDIFVPGTHGSTFGGNPLAAAVGIEALNILVEEQLPERSMALGKLPDGTACRHRQSSDRYHPR